MEKGNLYFLFEDRIYTVVPYSDGMELKKDHAYIIEDYVYIYRDEEVQEDSPMGIYRNGVIKDGTFEEKTMCSITNMVEFTPDKIIEVLESAKLYDEKDTTVIEECKNVFTPSIKSGDDFLKKIVKMVLQDKQISLKRYKNSFDKDHGLTNIRSSLVGTTKMSVLFFMNWAELLGFDWDIIVYDNKTDTQSPLSKPIIYNSKREFISLDEFKESELFTRYDEE